MRMLGKRTKRINILGKIMPSRTYLFFASILVIFSFNNCSLLDFFPPEIHIISPTEEITVELITVLSVRVRDEHFDRTEVFLDGEFVEEYAEREFSRTFYFATLGTRTIKVKSFDKCGNWRDEIVMVTVMMP